MSNVNNWRVTAFVDFFHLTGNMFVLFLHLFLSEQADAFRPSDFLTISHSKCVHKRSETSKIKTLHYPLSTKQGSKQYKNISFFPGSSNLLFTVIIKPAFSIAETIHLTFCWPCIIMYHNNVTNLIHFRFHNRFIVSWSSTCFGRQASIFRRHYTSSFFYYVLSWLRYCDTETIRLKVSSV
jgi:hypothetical protein